MEDGRLILVYLIISKLILAWGGAVWRALDEYDYISNLIEIDFASTTISSRLSQVLFKSTYLYSCAQFWYIL